MKNNASFYDIQASTGDVIDVNIINVDLVFDDKMISFSKIFDGNNIYKSSDKVSVSIDFYKKF